MRYSGAVSHKLVAAIMEAEDRDITLFSYGGDIGAMVGAIDLIKLKGFRTVGCGVIMSAAVPILAHGVEGGRMSLPNTRFMVHRGSFTLPDMAGREEIELESAEAQYWDDLYWSLLAERTRYSVKWWKKQCANGAHYFGPREAVKYGVIDGVITTE